MHATSASSFLEAHAGKLSGSQAAHEYDSILAQYSHNLGLSGPHTVGLSGSQEYGGGIHGGHQSYQDVSSGYQGGYGGNFQESYGSYGSQEHGGQPLEGHGYGGYDLHGLSSIGGYESLYGRGVDTNKVQDVEQKSPEPAAYGNGNVGNGHDGGSNEDGAYNKYDGGDQPNVHQKGPQEEENKGSNNYETPAYIGVSVTSYDDHSGRGGGYPETPNVVNYGAHGNYENNAEGNTEQTSEHGYQGYAAQNTEYHAQNNGGNYAHQAQSPNYAQLPQLALYQIQNGAATAIHYPNNGLQFYNIGHQAQGNYQNQEDNSYNNNQVDQGNYAAQGYQQHESPNDGEAGGYQQPQQQQQQAYAYQGQVGYQGESYQNNQAYPNHQNQENAGYGNENQEASYGNQNQEAYKNQEVYRNQESYGNHENSEGYNNQASYQVSPNAVGYQNEASYNNQEVAPGLQNYGLRAAYAVQPGAENHNQIQGAPGTVYVRAYDNQGENQAPYSAHNQEGYQTQDSQQQKTYAAYSTTKTVSSVSSTQQTDAPKQQTPAVGRSFESITNDQVVGSSSGYSQPEGGDTKGGSWQAVQ